MGKGKKGIGIMIGGKGMMIPPMSMSDLRSTLIGWEEGSQLNVVNWMSLPFNVRVVFDTTVPFMQAESVSSTACRAAGVSQPQRNLVPGGNAYALVYNALLVAAMVAMARRWVKAFMLVCGRVPRMNCACPTDS